MPEPSPSEPTADLTAPGDALDQGPAAAFGPDSDVLLTASGSVLRALSASLPDVPHVRLRDPDSGFTSPVVRPSSPGMPGRQSADTRLQLQREIARGGMGAVLRGRDNDLGRDVAVKVLLETHQGKTELVRRFVEEAQIAGQLQHPGIVPVYELGQFVDKRPYFTMKLVKGKTLSALLAARKDPAEDRTKFVGIFLQVCQTLAYAHARGVIHRDLKPSNVMVGAFGEVQVMDWGLAKVLAEGGADERKAQPQEEVSIIRTARSAGSGSESRAGSVLGTPAYMAPEQARGEVDKLDERCDVFGLGAILCQALTGQPPYTGRTGEEVYRRASAADTTDALAQLGGSGADAELVGLATRCLAAEPADRPRHAGEVAAAVAAHLDSVAERLRRTELARAAEAARAEEAKATAAQERRARRLTLGLAASVLLLVAVGAVGGLWAQRQQAERQAEASRHRQAAETALAKADALRQQARWAEAIAVLELARDRLGESGPDDLRERLDLAASTIALADRLERIRLKRATFVGGKFDNRTAEGDYAKEFGSPGLEREKENAAAVATWVRASVVREHLVAALDDWAAATADRKRRAWLLEVARRADPDPWRDRFRDPNVWSDRAALEKLTAELLRDEALLSKQKAPSLAALGTVLLLAKADAVPLLAAAQSLHPDDFWLNYRLGNALLDAKRSGEAVGYFRGAMAVRPDAAAVHNSLGNALADQKRLDEAIAEYRKAIALDPQYVLPHNGLGNALSHQAHWHEAVKSYRAAIALGPTYAKAHNNLGLALRALGRLDEAVEEFRAAVAFDADYPPAHNNLGNVLYDKGHLEEAMKEYRLAIALSPADASPHNNLGNALRDKKRPDEAIEEYRRAIALDPKYAPPHNGIGNALWDKGKIGEAAQEYRAAISLQPDYARPHYNLGLLLRAQGQYVESLALFRRAHELGSKQPGWKLHSAQQVRQAERLVVREVTLPAFLKGQRQPKNTAERLDLVAACIDSELYVASARLSAAAFAADPELASDLKTEHRYKAACAAALAGSGEGRDNPPPDDAAKAEMRGQALNWLRAELAAYAKLLDGKTAQSMNLVQKRLQHWQTDTDLAGLRDQGAVAALSAQEREACQELWAEVEALLKRAQEK